jgi:hypothetical protein
MDDGAFPDVGGSWSRARFLRAAVAGGAVVTGGAALGAARRGAAPLAATAKARDIEILNLFLTLEYVQHTFYVRALGSGVLRGQLLDYARAVAGQEGEHIAMLRERLGGRAGPQPKSNFEASESPEAFRAAAVDLEEAVLAVFVGQGANLSKAAVVPVTTLVSVEARQAAWVRDLAGVSPAPRAADPARNPDAVLGELRSKGLLA